MEAAATASERLFIGLWPDAAVQGAIADWRDAHVWPASATLVPTPKLHLTLHFLGEVASARIAPLGAALAAAGDAFAPFDLALGRSLLWHGGIAVLEPLAVPPGLLALQAALGDALDRCGLARERRPYRPHVTLARRAGGVQAPAPRSIDWHVDRFALMRSHQGLYLPLQTYTAK